MTEFKTEYLSHNNQITQWDFPVCGVVCLLFVSWFYTVWLLVLSNVASFIWDVVNYVIAVFYIICTGKKIPSKGKNTSKYIVKHFFLCYLVISWQVIDAPWWLWSPCSCCLKTPAFLFYRSVIRPVKLKRSYLARCFRLWLIQPNILNKSVSTAVHCKLHLISKQLDQKPPQLMKGCLLAEIFWLWPELTSISP